MLCIVRVSISLGPRTVPGTYEELDTHVWSKNPHCEPGKCFLTLLQDGRLNMAENVLLLFPSGGEV